MSSSSGQIKYQVIIDDSGVTSKVGNINNSLNSVGTSAEKASKGAGNLNTNLGNVATQSPSISSKIAKFGTTVGLVTANVSAFATGVIGLMRSYRDLGDAQVALDKKNLKVTTSTNAVATAQEKYNKAVKLFGVNSPQAKKALTALNVATEKQRLAVESAKIAQKTFNDSQQDFYLNIIPTAIGALGSFISIFSAMHSGLSGTSGAMNTASTASKALGTAMKAIPLFAIAGALLAIRTNAFGFRDALEAVGAKLGQILPGLKPFLQWVHDMAAALGLTGGNLDLGKAFDLLKTGFTGALDTIMKTDWSKVISDLVNNIAHFLETADWKAVLTETGKVLLNGLVAAAQAVTAWAPGFAKWVGEQLGKIFTKDNLIAAGTALLNGIIEAGKIIGPAFSSFVNWLGAELAKLFTKDNLVAAGSAILTGLMEAAKVIGPAFSSFVNWLNDELAKLFSKGNLIAAGNAVLTGIIEAAKVVIPNIVDFVKWLAGEIGKSMTAPNMDAAGKELIPAIFAAAKANIASNIAGYTEIVTWIGSELAKVFSAENLAVPGKAFLQHLLESAQTIEAAGDAFNSFVIFIGTEIGKLFSAKNLYYVGKALLDGIIGAAKATAAIVTPVVISIGTEVARLFTAKNLAEVGKRFLTAFVDAVKALPGLLSSLGQWIWEQIAGGAGYVGQKIQEAIKSIGPGKAEAGSGTFPKTDAVTSVDNTYAKAAMDELYQYWILIGGNIQGIIPALKADSKPATATMDAVMAVWRSKATTIGAILAPLKADSKPATQMMDAVTKVWQSKATTIGAIQAKLTANNADALAKINAVVTAQKKIINITQIIKGNNSDALNKINQVVNAQGKIKNITQTITTVYKTVGAPAHAKNIVGGAGAHTSTRLGGTAGEIMTTPLIGGGNMTNIVGGGQGDVNITIINRDEFGTEKVRKFKAVLGKDRYIFGASGSGG